MNIAQTLAIAVATYAYALHVEEPWSMRYATLAAEAHSVFAESESVGREALDRSHAFLVQALQQSANYSVRAYASSSMSQ